MLLLLFQCEPQAHMKFLGGSHHKPDKGFQRLWRISIHKILHQIWGSQKKPYKPLLGKGL